MLHSAKELKVKIFADGADLQTMVSMSKKSFIKGLTTNPTLMRKAGVSDYKKFAKEVLEEIQDKPISFEVFSDELNEMVQQAIEIASWGKNVNVKIPIMNSKGEETTEVVKELSSMGIALNVTAIFTTEQVRNVINVLDENASAYISVFAGRIADTGRDPIPYLQDSLEIMGAKPKSELIWASPRELLNVIQADAIGCHVITATPDILNRLETIGKDLSQYSLETVKMFRNDALRSNYFI
jgi:transaldolase